MKIVTGNILEITTEGVMRSQITTLRLRGINGKIGQQPIIQRLLPPKKNARSAKIDPALVEVAESTKNAV